MTYKNAVVITIAIVGFLLTAWMAPVAFAGKCDLTDLDCWGPDQKCNIKFKNETGMGSGSGGRTGYEQISSAATIKLSARKEDGTRAGRNTLQILAGADKTMNLDKKNDFNSIRIDRLGSQAQLFCQDIKTTLKGNGVCKVFVGQIFGKSQTVVNCDNGNVLGG